MTNLKSVSGFEEKAALELMEDPELSPALMKAFKCEVSQRNRRNA